MKTKKTCKNCRRPFNPELEEYPVTDSLYEDVNKIAVCGPCAEIIVAAINGEVETRYYVKILDDNNEEVEAAEYGFRSKRHAQEYGLGRVKALSDASPFRGKLFCHVGAYAE